MAAIRVRVAGLAAPENFGLDRLMQKLNRLQAYYEFVHVGSSESAGPSDLPRQHYSTKKLSETFRKLYPDSPEYQFELLLTAEKLEEDYFTLGANHLGLVSSADTELIRAKTGKPMEKLFAYNMMETLLWLQYDNEHNSDEEDRGCLFDSCYEKRSNITIGLHECFICDTCERLLTERHVPSEQLHAVRSVLRWVKRPPAGVYLKWASSIALLTVGITFVLVPDLANVGVASLGASGWVAAVPRPLFPFAGD